MNKRKLCTHNCPNCKFALVVENFDDEPFLSRPLSYDSHDEERERRTLLKIFNWVTPMKTLCYLPEELTCSYEIRTDATSLCETHPQIWVEQMTDLYECTPLGFLERSIDSISQKQEGAELDRREELWRQVHLAIYKRKTGHDYGTIENHECKLA